MNYHPSPIDNSHIELSGELAKLTELLARNNHDLWAKRRMDDGWSLGPQRDDAKKQTPLLIPYEDLPESEKDYDRANAVGTLKAILALGYRIQPPDGASSGR
jgi:RyR domain